MKSRCVYFIHINEVYKIHGLVHCCINIESERGLGQMKAHVQSCASQKEESSQVVNCIHVSKRNKISPS